ncbi:MAG: ribulose-phosphate 3-epimerase [Vicingaceae bacterium]
MPHLVAPSILAADFANLLPACQLVNQSKADYYHLDVMDGRFVPNISFGLPVIKALKAHAAKPFDVHLMIEEPDRYVADFKAAGADILTVHYEACPHLHRSIQNIKAQGMQAGIAINPHTSVELLENVIHDIDLVCVMSVNPGFGGQSFIEKTYDKVRRLKEMIVASRSNCKIEIDGGVGTDNAAHLVKAGADILVAGSSVFKAQDPMQAIAQLKQA